MNLKKCINTFKKPILEKKKMNAPNITMLVFLNVNARLGWTKLDVAQRANLLEAVRVYPEGHSDMHSPSWMTKLS